MDNVTLNKDGSIDTTYFKGDDFGAFNQTGIIINAINVPDTFIISKAELRVGKILLTFINPTFPITWTPAADITECLDYTNECYLAIYDADGRKRTCQGSYTFICRDKKV